MAGLLSLDGAPVEARRLHRMAALLAHRGGSQAFTAFPSDHTLPVLPWTDPVRPQPPEALSDAPAAFVFQASASADGRYWGVLDGAFASPAALAAELGVKEAGDADLLVAAWSAWGERCLDRLEGAFAFAIWDRPGHRLFLARDRFGIRPLYYAEADARIGFASGIKPLLAGLELPVRPRVPAVHDFLVHGFQDHRADTLFEGVHQVPPGHLVAVKARAASPRPYDGPPSAVLAPASAWEAARRACSGAPGIAVPPDADGFFDALPDLLWHREGPFPSEAFYARWLAFRAAAGAGLKSCASARGAREILLRPAGAISSLLGRLGGGRKPRFLTPELLASGREEEPVPSGEAFLRRNLAPVLQEEDRAGAAHGLELSLPFLQRPLVEAVLRFPKESKGLPLPPAPWVEAPGGWLGSARGRRLAEMLSALEQAGSPWVDWKEVRGELEAGKPLPELVPLLSADLWRAQALSPDYLAPRAR